MASARRPRHVPPLAPALLAPALLPPALLAAAILVPALAACDRAKPRHPPPDPFAIAPPPEAAPAGGRALSAGLRKRAEPAGFFLDHIGQAVDPFNRPPAVTPAGAEIVLDGFGFDPVAKAPGRGVDAVVDGVAYPARYGHARQDVARYFKAPALVDVGFRAALPAGALAPGVHTAKVRVISADGSSYFESPAVSFQVR
jgi:hypothetical protein